MSTNGYDLLVQVDEVLINKALAALYYSGFLALEGEHNFVAGIPEHLRNFTTFSYRIRMKNEPLVDYKGPEQIYIRFAVDLKLVVLTGIVLDFDVSFHIDAKLFYDALHRKLAFNVSDAAVTNLYVSNVYQFHKGFIDHINQVIHALLTAYFHDEVKTIDIPTVLYQLDLPMMPEGEDSQIPISLGDVVIGDNRLATVGINFFEPTTADLDPVTDYTTGSELYIAMQKVTMQRIFDFWWEHTTYDKSESFQGCVPLTRDAFLEKSAGILARVATLGLIEREVEYRDTVVNYQGTVTLLEKPGFEFGEDNQVILHTLKLGVNVQATVQATMIQDLKLDTSAFIPDRLTPWQDDRLLKHTVGTKNLLELDHAMEITIQEALGVLQLNESHNVVIDVVKADFEIDLGAAWYEHLTEHAVNFFMDLLERNILGKVPKLVISPALLSQYSVAGYTMQAEIDAFSFAGGDLSLQACIGIKELVSQAVPVPVYIGNTRTQKVHFYNCPSVDDIDMKHRVGYYVLYEALKAGYSTCRACIGAERAVNEEGMGK